MIESAPMSPAEPGRSIRFSGRAVVPALSGTYLALAVLCAATGSLLAPESASNQNLALGPTAAGHGHLLGTDQLGRDAFSLLIAGTRSAIGGPLAVALACLIVGCSLGMAGAYYGGFVDSVVSRLADLIYTLPALVVAIVVLGVTGGGYWISALVLAVLSVPYAIRINRSAALSQMSHTYVEAARTIGFSDRRILFRHILPNIMPTVLATFLLDFVIALIGFAALSYLGLGIPPGAANWGVMLSQGESLITVNPWLVLAPALAYMLTAVSATLLGDWLQQRLGGGSGEAQTEISL